MLQVGDEGLFPLIHFQYFNTVLVKGLSSPGAFCAVQGFCELVVCWIRTDPQSSAHPLESQRAGLSNIGLWQLSLRSLFPCEGG